MEGIRFSYRIRLRVNSTATPQEPSGLGSVRTTVPRAASRKAGATPASAESRTATVTSAPKGISLITDMWSPPWLRLSSTACSVNTRPVLSTPFTLPGKGASIRAVSLRSFTEGSRGWLRLPVVSRTKISPVRNSIKPIGCAIILPALPTHIGQSDLFSADSCLTTSVRERTSLRQMERLN
jgi:hypothetical protein